MIIFPPNPAAQTPVNVFSPTSTPLSSDNYTTYTYDGEKWVAAPGIDGGGGGGTSYWERSGDTLNPINDGDNLAGLGSASFAGAVSSPTFDQTSTTTQGYLLTEAGALNCQRASGSTQAIFLGYQGTTNTVEIKADGSATFAGGNVNIESSGVVIGSTIQTGAGNTITSNGRHQQRKDSAGAAYELYSNGSGNSDRTIIFDADGSASFASDLQVGGATFAGQVVANVNNASGSDSALKAVQTNANGYALWIGSGPSAANRTAYVLPDGSATFAGTIYHRTTPTGPSVAMGSSGFTAYNGTTSTFQLVNTGVFNLGGDVQTGNGNIQLIGTTGTATFTGTVTSANSFAIQLEADDESQYETTTEEYEDTIKVPVIGGVGTADLVEGETERFEEKTITRTREVKTYVGPVLDVKETLVKYETSLTKLKAAVAEASNFEELKTAMTLALSNI